MQIALYQPDIPQNLGSILRLCTCMDVTCHIIEPCGFPVDDKKLRRVAMDYIDKVVWQRHVSWEQFMLTMKPARILLLTTKTTQHYCKFAYQASDILLLGRESAGVPEAIAAAADAKLTIPMAEGTRSLNIAQAASMVLGEALRQTRWK